MEILNLVLLALCGGGHCTSSSHPNLWFGCTEMRRLTILTAWLVRTQETIQISLSEDTFMIFIELLVRAEETILEVFEASSLFEVS